jgi:ribonuclease HI
MLEIATDGAYSPIRDSGGVGIVFFKGDKVIKTYNRQFKDTTNNKCELMAVIMALEASKSFEDVTIYSDSQYVIGCITKGWERKKNKRLWKQFDETLAKCKNVNFQWVKGHTSGNAIMEKMNNLADSLAVEASQWV